MPVRFLDRPLQNTWTSEMIIKGFILLSFICFLMVWIVYKILVIEKNIKIKYTRYSFKSVLPLKMHSITQSNNKKTHTSTEVLLIHINYQKLASNLFNPCWVHEKNLHSAQFFFLLLSSRLIAEHTNIACLNAKGISTGNLYQLWHNNDSAEQGTVKTQMYLDWNLHSLPVMRMLKTNDFFFQLLQFKYDEILNKRLKWTQHNLCTWFHTNDFENFFPL